MRYPSGTVGEGVEDTTIVPPPAMDHGGRYPVGFPESFQRTFPSQEEDDAMSDGSLDMTPPFGAASSALYAQDFALEREQSPTPPRRFSRSSVMRLENILNDVSIDYDCRTGTRSLCTSPTRTEADDSVSEPVFSRSESPVETTVKKKKVKMHKCPECHKDFPRPSGLRTHMNMHTKEKPFACTFPGCTRTFSVVSNAKRHMRTHGLGVPADDGPSDPSASVPYVVGFETPVVVAPELAGPAQGGTEPLKLRWVSLARSSPSHGTHAQGVGAMSDTVGVHRREENPHTDTRDHEGFRERRRSGSYESL